jgi:hypothetical protein
MYVIYLNLWFRPHSFICFNFTLFYDILSFAEIWKRIETCRKGGIIWYLSPLTLHLCFSMTSEHCLKILHSPLGKSLNNLVHCGNSSTHCEPPNVKSQKWLVSFSLFEYIEAAAMFSDKKEGIRIRSPGMWNSLHDWGLNISQNIGVSIVPNSHYPETIFGE